MLESFFGSNIPLYIEKNPVEKLCEVLEMEPETYTLVGPKFVFEKIKFKLLHYIQHDFNRQRPGFSKDQTSMFKNLVISYFILKIVTRFIHRNWVRSLHLVISTIIKKACANIFIIASNLKERISC